MLRRPREPTRSATLVQWCGRIVCELDYTIVDGLSVLDAGMYERSWTLRPRDSSGRHGMAIALSQQADLALLAWEPVNDRMAYVRLKGHFTNISIVALYAPTSAAEQRNNEAFYSQLQALVERLPRRDLLIVAGNWNDRTGPRDPTTALGLVPGVKMARDC
nr:unnamed protein product [Spirometra erinaceieuropaei]